MSLLTGLLLIVVGIIMLAQPKMSLTFFIWLFGIGVIVYGVLHAVIALRGGNRNQRGETQKAAGVTAGVLAVIAGLIILAWPGLTAAAMVYIIAGWAIVAGVIDVFHAFTPGHSAAGRVWLIVSGIAGVVLGLIIMVYPADGILAILWLVAIYLIVAGVLRMILGVVAPAGKVGQAHGGPHPF